jgi:tRNA wybutosine-synthesizing protein 2
VSDAQVLVFNEDNASARRRLEEYGVKVRHVNLGLLPSSRGAWKIAAEILGWIHIHGNYRDAEIEQCSDDVIQEFKALFGTSWTAGIAERFRVKEFGPGVGHWVLDLRCKHNS